MEDGWIKLWRKSFDSAVWKNKNLWRLWTYCLLKANHERKWVSVKTGEYETEVEILPGQFIFGRNISSKDTKIKPSTINYLMQKLKTMGNVDIQSNTHYSIISIINWGTYQCRQNEIEQPPEQPLDTHLTPTEQAPDTNKNDKNVKNDKNKEIYGGFFLKFWNEYPKKKGKPNAFKEWNKLKPDLEIVLPALKAQKEEKERLLAENKFCPEWPDPERWIKNQRWLDEICEGPIEDKRMWEIEQLRRKQNGHSEST